MASAEKPISIAVIGTGKIGKAVAQLLLRAGYTIYFGSRTPQKNHSFADEIGTNVIFTSVEDAAAKCVIIVLAVPYQALDDLISNLKLHAAGKIVIDTTNPFAFSPERRIVSSLGSNQTAGSRMATLLPASRIIRAFNHIAHELLLNRGMNESGVWSMAIAGDDVTAKRVASNIVRECGFSPVDIGALADSLPLDPGGRLFPHLFTEADMRALLQ